MKIAAVNGSLVKGGNVAFMVDYAVEEYRDHPEVEVERIDLAESPPGPCRHCNWCLKKQVEGKYCAQEDSMASIYPVLLEASGLLIASPAHFGRLSGTTADFLDRLRVFVHGNLTRGAMRNKVGGSLSVSWFRNAGNELTLMTIDTAFHVLGMVVASPDLGIHGAAAFSSVDGLGQPRKGERVMVGEDAVGMASARSLAYRVYELARLLEAGRDTIT